ncbi:MAG: MCP four helix bundle domain-containing protein [Oryzomonas sp.]|uniref:MCP four helix bundle domain-containing protein n=1 Tax=Oryzomonas sp. TaxID=2855186 RepID=UPI00283C8283|nr:MCP four helix bundle domain-containing protein [Oryzomonas sp.]MDR3578731.1 MCP four helix bundle domain-containing protein [Oryzomonas sp.]
MPSIVVLGKVMKGYGDITKKTYQHVLNTDDTAMANIEKAISEDRERIDKALKDYEPLVSDDKDKKMLADDRAVLIEVATVRDKVLALSRLNKTGRPGPGTSKSRQPLPAGLRGRP